MAISKKSVQASEKLDHVLAAYECYDHQHAIAILIRDYPELLSEICDSLIVATANDGDNPTAIMAQSLDCLGWRERTISIRLSTGGKPTRTETHTLDRTKLCVAVDFGSDLQRLPSAAAALFRGMMRRDGIAAKVVVDSADARSTIADEFINFSMLCGEFYPTAFLALKRRCHVLTR